MKKSSKNVNIIELISYIALIILALLVITNSILPLLTINISTPVLNVLENIKDLFIVIVVGIHAYQFIVGKPKWVIITYWVCVALFVIGSALIWLN